MRIQATVYQRVEVNTAGVVAVTYPTSYGNVSGIFLPTGGQIVQKQYGLECVGEYEYYAKSRNSYLLPGNRLLIGGNYYNIVAIRDYVKVITCLLQKVVA